MEENKKIPLSHTILYCKNWYEQSENPFYDLRKTLTADGYSGEYFSDSDIVHLLIGKMDEYYDIFKRADNSFGIYSMYEFIDRYDRMEDGFKEKPIEYKLWRFFRSYVFPITKNDFIAVEPDYSILPRKKYYTKKWLDWKLYPEFESWCFDYDFKTTEIFKTKIADKALKKALKELKKKYSDMLEEYNGKESNIINLVKEEYTERFIKAHPRQFYKVNGMIFAR